MDYLPAEVVEYPGTGEVDAAVIWLHGLGADGHDFPPIVPQLPVERGLQIRYIFPHAPEIPVTINNGWRMRAWYDIQALNVDRHVDVAQLLESARRVQDLVDRERERGIASERILIGGFSQGGAVAFEAALTYPAPLAGLFSLSSYLATAATLQVNPAQNRLPILVCHGDSDGVVPEALGRRSVLALKNLGLLAAYHTYPMDHAVCPAEILEIGGFISRTLTPSSP